MSWGGVEGLSPPSNVTPEFEHWFAQVVAEIMKAAVRIDARVAAEEDLQGQITTLDGSLTTHITDETNPHSVTAAQVQDVGTWTPAYSPTTGSFDTISYSQQTGIYVRTGSLVYVSAQLELDNLDVGTSSGVVNITGLPFATAADAGTQVLSVGYTQGWTNAPLHVLATASSSSLLMRRRTAVDGTTFTVQVSNMDPGVGAGSGLIFSGTYKTDAA
jgi:hypothetical protein